MALEAAVGDDRADLLLEEVKMRRRDLFRRAGSVRRLRFLCGEG
jgi:hypothetical protein